VDANKIVDMKNWPTPGTIKGLHGFLIFTGYCYKFIHDYDKIIVPLTTLLKKDSFTWSDVAKRAFESLKIIICNTSILAMPNFTKTFVIKSDTSRVEIGSILMQEG